MEFLFDINIILPLEITIINGDYQILNNGYTMRISSMDKLTSIIDTIGDASYRAQGLPGPVTTARKFRISDHRLYIVKNASHHNHFGSVIGFLKVGAKRLYVHDSHGQVHERTPLCVLDFYVHESKQRSGYGKKLFDAMLEFEKCSAHELAIDRPSNKCLGFLQKHYQLSAPVRQVNNFVVFNAFFNKSPIPQHHRSQGLGQYVDNFRRQESTAWILASEKQQNYRPISEQYENNRGGRLRGLSNEDDPFKNRRQATTIGTLPNHDQRKPLSAFPTSYAYQHNQNTLLREPTKTNEPTSHISRTYTELFRENNPFPSLQRYNTNPVFPSTKTAPSQPYTFKDYQSGSANNPRPVVDPRSEPEPLTSIYTFPSLIKPTNNWRKPHPQPSTIDATSSAWRLFGVNRVLN